MLRIVGDVHEPANIRRLFQIALNQDCYLGPSKQAVHESKFQNHVLSRSVLGLVSAVSLAVPTVVRAKEDDRKLAALGVSFEFLKDGEPLVRQVLKNNSGKTELLEEAPDLVTHRVIVTVYDKDVDWVILRG